jgi:hypothetical protein
MYILHDNSFAPYHNHQSLCYSLYYKGKPFLIDPVTAWVGTSTIQ